MIHTCVKPFISKGYNLLRLTSRLPLCLHSSTTSIEFDSLGNSRGQLTKILNEAIKVAFNDIDSPNATVLPANKGHGDYQSNIAMILSKNLKLKPIDIATKVIDNLLKHKDLIDGVEISGPGFLNFKLSDNFIKSRLVKMLKDSERLGIDRLASPQRVVIDFSSPNIAKEMHVGHLRSTIIGDTLSRVLEFLGHDVLRLNHVGDWGTQFGMLIRYLMVYYPQQYARYCDSQSIDNADIDIGDLVEFYKEAKKVFDSDSDFKEAAKAEVVRLQQGETNTLTAWKAICDLSRREFQVIYNMLNIRVNERGESFYNSMLENVVSELESKGIAVDSEGAKCIFLPGYFNTDGSPLPFLIRKSDGGYLYASTDLAALKHRVEVEKAQRIIYVTDAGQAQHFQMLFDASRLSGLAPSQVQLTHVTFGVVQGEDGKKFKSRSGDTVKLKDLLNEAVLLAERDIANRKKSDSSEEIHLTDEEKLIARVIGIGAVKYADLSMNRESNYRFSYNKMLSLTGNTAPYMLYAYVRIQGIQRKAAETLGDLFDLSSIDSDDLVLTMPEEISLSKQLIQWDEIIHEVAKDLYPNRLCDYIFELSQKFNQFYEKCPVLKADSRSGQISRAALCTITANVLKKSLDLLGIETVNKI
eukprot:gene17659-23246_t